MLVKDKLKYNQFVLDTKKHIQEYETQINSLKKRFSDNEITNQYVALSLITYHIKIINMYFKQNDMYMSYAGSSNKPIMDVVRKVFAEIDNLLKKYFSVIVSGEFSKERTYPKTLDKLNPTRILSLLTQLNISINKLIEGYGITSRYTISVANIYGDICGFMLSMVDFPYYLNHVRDLKHQNYIEIKQTLELVAKMLESSGTMYIDAYHISEDKEQARRALLMINTLETFYRLTNQSGKLPELDRKKQSWERFLSV